MTARRRAAAGGPVRRHRIRRVHRGVKLARASKAAARARANDEVRDAQARAELRALTDEQTTLRCVAALIARGAGEDQIYDGVTTGAGDIVEEATMLIRFDAPHSYTVVAGSRGSAEVGSHIDVAAGD